MYKSKFNYLCRKGYTMLIFKKILIGKIFRLWNGTQKEKTGWKGENRHDS